MLSNLNSYSIILASKSPRRQELLKGLELDFEIRVLEVDESFPENMHPDAVPEFISKQKAEQYRSGMVQGDLLITSDTIVVLENEILEKPIDHEDAKSMLLRLSGKQHEVITGVCLTTLDSQISFSDKTLVEFNTLEEKEVEHYIKNYQPFDKAGAYGVQDFIGFVGIKKLEGCYYNVMGLPLQKLYSTLKKF